MIIAGIKLTFLGMGVCYLFILLLILVINICFKLLGAGSAIELAEMEAAELRKMKKTALAAEDKILVAVISAAVTAHRARHES
jgi:sodium pump decarboxylase gamma subunit